jgi:hypothetical protein
LVGITFPTASSIGGRLPFFLMQNKGRKKWQTSKREQLFRQVIPGFRAVF